MEIGAGKLTWRRPFRSLISAAATPSASWRLPERRPWRRRRAPPDFILRSGPVRRIHRPSTEPGARCQQVTATMGVLLAGGAGPAVRRRVASLNEARRGSPARKLNSARTKRFGKKNDMLGRLADCDGITHHSSMGRGSHDSFPSCSNLVVKRNVFSRRIGKNHRSYFITMNISAPVSLTPVPLAIKAVSSNRTTYFSSMESHLIDH